MSVTQTDIKNLNDYIDYYQTLLKDRDNEYSYHLRKCYFIKDGKYYDINNEEMHPAELDGTLPMPSRRPITLSHLSFIYRNVRTGALKSYTWVGKFRLLTYRQPNGTEQFCPLILSGCRSFNKVGFTIMGVDKYKIMRN